MNGESIAMTNKELTSIRSHIIGSVFTLLAIGIVLIYSASAIRAGNGGWELFFMANQARWLKADMDGAGGQGLIGRRPGAILVGGVRLGVRGA